MSNNISISFFSVPCFSVKQFKWYAVVRIISSLNQEWWQETDLRIGKKYREILSTHQDSDIELSVHLCYYHRMMSDARQTQTDEYQCKTLGAYILIKCNDKLDYNMVTWAVSIQLYGIAIACAMSVSQRHENILSETDYKFYTHSLCTSFWDHWKRLTHK